MSDPPDLVGARYRVEEQLGRGGMATVYRAHDEQLGRAVAIKLMREELGEDRQFVRRFEAEARRAASVTHPNVVAVYDVGSDGAPYIVMELVEGGDLSTVLASQGRLPINRAIAIASDVAAALQAAHDAGLVHRDVKPGNILLGTDGRARVADFGIARATGEESMTKTGAMLGSVEYFSPEQARGERASTASDIYALGVVLYELLTGKRPFHGDSPYAVATARLREPSPDPRDVTPDVPDVLAQITKRAMAVEPAERFRSAGEMRSALESWRAAHEVAPPTQADVSPNAAEASVTRTAIGGDEPPAPAPPTTRDDSDGRRRVPIWGAVAVLLLMAIAGYAGARLLQGPDDPAVSNPLDVVVGTPAGEVLSNQTATPEQTAEATAPPTAEATTRATPEPTVPATPQPTATPASVAEAPDAAVAAFYRYVVRGDFDAAYALWSSRMQATYPRQENLDDRFANTAEITFSELSVASQSAASATVQANFTETYDSGSSRQFIGYWQLVRVDGAWLLDEPNY